METVTKRDILLSCIPAVLFILVMGWLALPERGGANSEVEAESVSKVSSESKMNVARRWHDMSLADAYLVEGAGSPEWNGVYISQNRKVDGFNIYEKDTGHILKVTDNYGTGNGFDWGHLAVDERAEDLDSVYVWDGFNVGQWYCEMGADPAPTVTPYQQQSNLADAYQVSGAGESRYNGVYRRIGTVNGKYQYGKDDVYTLTYLPSADAWWLEHYHAGRPGPSEVGYTAGTGDIAGPWELSDADYPPPIVTAYGETLSYDASANAETSTDGKTVFIPVMAPSGIKPATGLTGFTVTVNGSSAAIATAKVVKETIPGEGYIVSGAGSNVFNGLYSPEGLYNSRTSYKNRSNMRLYTAMPGVERFWALSDNTDDFEFAYAGPEADNEELPSDGPWQATLAPAPAPTVIASGGTLYAIELTLSSSVIYEGDVVQFFYSQSSGNVTDDNSVAMTNISPTTVINSSTVPVPRARTKSTAPASLP